MSRGAERRTVLRARDAKHGLRSSWRGYALRLGAGLAVFGGLWLTVSPPDGGARWTQFGLGAVAVAGAVVSRRLPLAGAGVALAATGLGWMLGVTADPFVLTGFAVFAFAESRGERRFPWWMPFGTVVLLFGALVLGAEGAEDRFRGMLLGAVVLAASWTLGVRSRQAREAAAARARAEERLRLARDVHDVLSHSLGAIGVRAGVAAHVATLGESDLRTVLREMEQDARTSLAELKGLLRRERGTAPDDDDAPPSLSLAAGLADLVRAAERAGLQARVDAPAALDELPATVRTTLYRVAQEAVTNTIRHAAAAAVTIALSVSDGVCRVEVRDDGEGAVPGFREGHGLIGMRERVESLGGTVTLEAASSGFALVASLPLPIRAPGSTR